MRPVFTDVASSETLSWARGRVHTESPESSIPVPATRLIHVGKPPYWGSTVKLHECARRGHEKYPKYATLSYCWGQTSQFKATKANIEGLYRGFDLDSLSQTVRDAVEVTRSLGLSYLWVDALCIIQDDEDDKSKEIELIATIYKNAAVTIAALSASGTTQGFLRTYPPRRGLRSCSIPFPFGRSGQVGTISLHVKQPPIDLCDTPLCYRGWAFQELFLSPRILLYSTEELLWYSRASRLQSSTTTTRTYRDNIHDILSVPVNDVGAISYYRELEQDSQPPEIKAQRQQSVEIFQHSPYKSFVDSVDYYQDPLQEHRGRYNDQCKIWAAIVTEYTSRKLSEREDRLRALAGVANHLREIWASSYVYGMWRNAIPDLLQWAVRKPVVAGRSNRAPTWSWASVDCPVGYPGDLKPDSRLRSEIEVVSVDSSPSYSEKPGIILRGFLMEVDEFERRQFGFMGDTEWYHDGTLGDLSEGFNLQVLLLLSSPDGNLEMHEAWDYELGRKLKEIGLLLRQVEEGIYVREGVGIRYWYSRTPELRSHEAWGRLRVITIK